MAVLLKSKILVKVNFPSLILFVSNILDIKLNILLNIAIKNMEYLHFIFFIILLMLYFKEIYNIS